MESTLSAAQNKYVQLMIDENVYTNDELAEACGVDVRTIYRWKHNQKVTNEINRLADASLGQFIIQANKKLVDVISEGSEHAQLKAIDMLYKSLGKYKEQADISITDNSTTVEEKKALLLQRLKGQG